MDVILARPLPKKYIGPLIAHDEVNVHCSPAKYVFSTIVNFIMSAS